MSAQSSGLLICEFDRRDVWVGTIAYIKYQDISFNVWTFPENIFCAYFYKSSQMTQITGICLDFSMIWWRIRLYRSRSPGLLMNENHLYSFGTQYIYQDIFTDERICPYDTKTFQMIQRISQNCSLILSCHFWLLRLVMNYNQCKIWLHIYQDISLCFIFDDKIGTYTPKTF